MAQAATDEAAASSNHALSTDTPASIADSNPPADVNPSLQSSADAPQTVAQQSSDDISLDTQAAPGQSSEGTTNAKSSRSDANRTIVIKAENLDVIMAEASYGTRSRNRTSTRPNYSEEQEVDFEYATPPAAPSRRKATESAAAASQDAKDGKRASDSNFAASNDVNGTGASASSKATSANASATGAGNSKKRKAAGTSAAASHSTTASSTPPPAGARRAGGPVAPVRETNLMSFAKHKHCLNKKDELVADDGTRLSVNDHVYLVCEPPGDPYYLCRIMEFLHVDAGNPSSPVDSVRVNWYYRPRDVQRFSTDTRLVFGTMHSDMCPITSLRGKCTIKHRSEIDDLDAYRRERDSFYFVQVFDRFIRRSYECIPVQQIINVPDKVKKALNERWKFVVVEIGRVKELTSAAKSCKRCTRYCATTDSVDCAICKNSYHMNCVQPPLPKKPSRGFAWACGPCSRDAMKEMEARNTPTVSGKDGEEEEVVEEEVPEASNDTTRAPSPQADDMAIDEHPATQAEIALAKMWPMRYLGIHARLEDALQYDDRAIYPRASSRLGPRHQANTTVWHGRPVELVKPAEIKKRYQKGGSQKKEGKLTKETLALIEADREAKAKRPKWVQDEPAGYVARGEDYDNDDPRCTAKLIYKMPTEEQVPNAKTKKDLDEFVDVYMGDVEKYAKQIGVPWFGTNFRDKCVELLAKTKYNAPRAAELLQKVNRQKDLHEPVITRSELQRFEEGVAKYGSEHRLIRLHMKSSLPHGDIVRFYYLWKKTQKGHEIWGNYGGRKKRKLESDAGAKLQAEIANEADDSAFDNDKAARKNRSFQCKFCNTMHSRQWRRAPGVSPGQMVPADTKGANKDKKDRPLLALCLRCAGLWRKYAVQWEDIDDVKKAGPGGKGLKRKIDEELYRELVIANEAAQEAAMVSSDNNEPAKKKTKLDKEALIAAAESQKKKEKALPPPKEPTPPPPPIIPTQPAWRDLPCAVCKGVGDTVACQHCKLTVHRRCFGLRDSEGVKADGEVKWVCEQCQNDRNPAVSTEYSCCLCLTEETLIDLVEPPKVSHKKKGEREREKERMEKELADNMRAEYRARQLANNRPAGPREPLKCTTGNNWVHVYCAVWAPEIRFSNAKALQVAEGFQLIPQPRFEAVCKLCKNKDHQNRVRENAGACINCFQCNASFHASCAFEAGYQFGFDVQPVKGSRKDSVTTATLGSETGSLTAVVLCKEHISKTIVHPINEPVDEAGTTALQVFVENYKQADLTLTGTVRKAQLAQQTKDKGQQPSASAASANRRESAAHGIAAAVKRGSRASLSTDARFEGEGAETSSSLDGTDRHCVKCNIDVTPQWHEVTWAHDRRSTKPTLLKQKSSAGDVMEIERVMNGIEQKPIMTSEPPQSLSQPKQQHIRFMAPGANGRAWEGMPDRHRSATSVDRASAEAPNGISSDEQGQHQQSSNGHALPYDCVKLEAEGHNNALSQSQPTMNGESQTGWMCHKCFLQKKLVPTPPPEDHSDTRKAENDRRSQPPILASIEEQFRLWDEPPPPPPPPPPQAMSQMMNGMGPSPLPPYLAGFGSLPPPQSYHPPPPQHFGPQQNGYHPGPPPPPLGMHRHAPGLHERHGSFGYQHPPPSSGPPSYSLPHPHARPQPPPLNGFPHGSPPPIQSDLRSPLGQPQMALPSPTYPHGGQPHQMQPLRQEPTFPPHLSPIGAPAYSRQDPVFGAPRPDVKPASASIPIDPSLMGGSAAPPTAQGHAGMPNGPVTSAPLDYANARLPPVPARQPPPPAANPPPTGGGSGASNSPSVANLLS